MVLNPNPVAARVNASARRSYRNGTLELTFEAMATRCRVLCGGQLGQVNDFAAFVLEWVAAFESRYSRFIPESLISRINAAAGADWVETDPESDHIFKLCDELHFLTRGLLDPTALPVLRLWDWKKASVPEESQVKEALQKVGWRKVQRFPGRIFLPEKGMAIDLGGVGKEYAVDFVTQLAISTGLKSILVDFGQDIRVNGTPTEGKPMWHVGLEDPQKPGTCWADLGLFDGGIATSGDYVRSFTTNGKRYGHIVDPRTGYPVSNGCLSVSVFAPHCVLAGALSTAAFVLGEREGIALIDSVWNAEGCITTENNRYPSRRFYEHVASENRNTR